MVGRVRWFGAGLAAALVCGGAIRSDVGASIGSGERSTYVAITPCRLFDTRPGTDNVGSRATPLAAGETFTIQARGPQGKCNIPADASGLSLNVAVIGGTAGSYLTVFPAGTDVPLAANLNWVAGQPPTPNKVDVGLSADGKVSFYNYAGTVNVAADVNGYYVDHTHDDRYYTKAEADSKYATKADSAATYATKSMWSGHLVIDANAMAPRDSDVLWSRDMDEGLYSTSAGGVDCFVAPVVLPNHATMTRLWANVFDQWAGTVLIALHRNAPGPGRGEELASAWSNGGIGDVTIETTTFTDAVIDTAGYSYSLQLCMAVGANYEFYDATIDYTLG